jgi:hypothetical protein
MPCGAISSPAAYPGLNTTPKPRGSFLKSSRNASAVCDYIARQEEHHRRRTFEEEYLEFLQRHEIEYDPRFVFD